MQKMIRSNHALRVDGLTELQGVCSVESNKVQLEKIRFVFSERLMYDPTV